MMLSAVIFKDQDMYVAECLEVRTLSQGYTIEEALSNLKKATELYLKEFPLEKHLIHCLPLLKLKYSNTL